MTFKPLFHPDFSMHGELIESPPGDEDQADLMAEVVVSRHDGAAVKILGAVFGLAIVIVLVAAASFAAPARPALDLERVALPRIHHSGPVVYQFDPVTLTARCTVERITVDTLKGNAERKDSFPVDQNLPEALRRSDACYRSSGFDRGHLPGAANYGRQADRDATFLASLIVPQPPRVNRGPIKTIETRCRELVDADHELVVATLTLTHGRPRYITPTGPAIPQAIGKAVLVIERGVPAYAIAWKVPNFEHGPDDPNECLVSVDELEDDSQLELFSELPDDVENRIEAAVAAPR